MGETGGGEETGRRGDRRKHDNMGEAVDQKQLQTAVALPPEAT